MADSIRKLWMGNGNSEKSPYRCPFFEAESLRSLRKAVRFPKKVEASWKARVWRTKTVYQGPDGRASPPLGSPRHLLSPAPCLSGSSWRTQRGSKLLSQMQNDSPGKLIRFIDEEAKARSGDIHFPSRSISWTSESRDVIKVSFHFADGNSPRTC